MAISSVAPAPWARAWTMRRTRPSMLSRSRCHSSRSCWATTFPSCRSPWASPMRDGSPICLARCWGPAPSSSSAPTSATTTPTRQRRLWTGVRRLPSRRVIPTASAPMTPVGSSPCAALSSGRAASILPSACSTSARPPTPPVIRPGSSATAPSRSRVIPEPGEDAGGDGVAIVAGESPERHVRTSLDFGDEAPAALADGGHDGPAGVEQRAHGGHEPRRQALHLADFVDEIDVDLSVHGERGPRRGLEHGRIDAILAHAGTAAAVDVSHDRALAVEGDQLEPSARAPTAHLLGKEPAETRARELGRHGADRGGLANSGRPGDQERHGGRAPSRALPGSGPGTAADVGRGSGDRAASGQLPDDLTHEALGPPRSIMGLARIRYSPGRSGSGEGLAGPAFEVGVLHRDLVAPEGEDVAARDLDLLAVGGGSGEEPLGEPTVARDEVSRVAEVRVGEALEHAREPLAHSVLPHEALAPWIRPSRELEYAVVRHERHEVVHVVPVPAVAERFEILDRDHGGALRARHDAAEEPRRQATIFVAAPPLDVDGRTGV